MEFTQYCKMFRTDILSQRERGYFTDAYVVPISPHFYPIVNLAKAKNLNVFTTQLPNNDLRDYCVYCGIHLNNKVRRNIEHLIPKSRGGNNTDYNRRPSCVTCNSDKENLTPLEYLEVLRIRLSVATDAIEIYELEIRIYNVEHVIHYVETARDKLLTAAPLRNQLFLRSKIKSKILRDNKYRVSKIEIPKELYEVTTQWFTNKLSSQLSV